MSPAPTYLAQNHFGIYYFRLAVPVKLREIIGRRELRQSLRTKNRKEAMAAARRMAVAAESYFRGERMTQDELDRLLRISTEIKIKGINWHPDGNLSIESIEMDPNNEESEIRMLDSLVDKVGTVPSGSPYKHDVRNERSEMTLSELISEYVKNQTESNRWTEKTLAENRAIYALMIRYFGDVPLSELTSQAARDFRSDLLKLPTNLNKKEKLKNKPIKEISKRKYKQTLSESSVNKYMRRISQMLEWSVEENHAERNGFKKKQIRESKKPNERRDALTLDEIAAIF